MTLGRMKLSPRNTAEDSIPLISRNGPTTSKYRIGQFTRLMLTLSAIWQARSQRRFYMPRSGVRDSLCKGPAASANLLRESRHSDVSSGPDDNLLLLQ